MSNSPVALNISSFEIPIALPVLFNPPLITYEALAEPVTVSSPAFAAKEINEAETKTTKVLSMFFILFSFIVNLI